MKSTKSVVQQRVEKVWEMRLLGASLIDLRRYASAPETPDQPWNVSDRQLERYIVQADKLNRRCVEKRADRQFALALLKLERVYALCFEQGDYRGALRALETQARLLGLYPAQRVEHSGPGGGAIPVNATSGAKPIRARAQDLTDEQLAAFLADVADARRQLEAARPFTPIAG